MSSLKEIAANAGVECLENGMIVGLGSGTTSELALAAIGRRVAQGLRIVGIPTSERIAELARGMAIPLATLAEHPQVDITIDGADEVESGTLHLIKGGGGNLLREKIVAAASARLVIVADESKVVEHLGTSWAIPVEVVPFGWQSTLKRLQDSGAKTTLRVRDGKTYVTDGGHYIADCFYGQIMDPPALQSRLDGIVGVVEHGLFLGMVREAVIGGREGVTRLYRK